MDQKIIGLVGPTSSGKSDLVVKLSKKFNGEIISADSRQVYRGLDVGSGKITPAEMQGIPHHLLNVADPADADVFSLAQYLKLARQKIKEISKRGHIPFVVGGTGLYVTALLKGYFPPDVPPDQNLRDKLKNKSLTELQVIYKQIDSMGFKKIDINNPRRLIRAIEVVSATGKPFFDGQKKSKNINICF